MSQPLHPLRGIALLVAACACFALLDTSMKFGSAAIPALMAVWARYLLQAVATSAFVLPRRGWAAWQTRHLPFQVLRGLMLTGASLMAYLSLRYLPVAEFTSILMLAPIVVTLLAGLWLKERVSPLRWSLVAGGFLGTLLIVRPGGSAFTLATLLPFCALVCVVAFQLLTSRLARTEDPLTVHLYSGWVGTAATAVALPYAWTWDLAPAFWAVLLAMGVLGTVGHLLFILAFRNARASTLTPLIYSQVGFAMLAGWVFFGHIPDPVSFSGMALITACGAASAWLSAREQRQATDDR